MASERSGESSGGRERGRPAPGSGTTTGSARRSRRTGWRGRVEDRRHDGEIFPPPIARQRVCTPGSPSPRRSRKPPIWAIPRTVVRRSTAVGGRARRRVWTADNGALSADRTTGVQGGDGCSRARYVSHSRRPATRRYPANARSKRLKVASGRSALRCPRLSTSR